MAATTDVRRLEGDDQLGDGLDDADHTDAHEMGDRPVTTGVIAAGHKHSLAASPCRRD